MRYKIKINDDERQLIVKALYREEDASPEIRELKREVESKKAVLQKRHALFCNRRWAAAADAVTNGRPAVVAAGQFNRSLSA